MADENTTQNTEETTETEATGDTDNNNTDNTNNTESNGNDSKDSNKLFKHSAKDFEMGNILGDGAFGKVVVGTVINETSPYFKQKFAIKIMDKRHIVKNKKIKYVNIEKQVFLKTKKHPFICHMHFSYQDPYSLFMVLDLCTEDTLSFLIYKYINLSEEVTRIYVSELVSCLEFMHSIGIYHRDIKPENILIAFDGHIRLTDFGTAKVIDMDDEKQVQAAKEKQEKGVQSDSDNENENQNENTNENGSENNNETNENNTEETDKTKNSKHLKPDFNEKRDRKQSFVGTAQYVPPEMLSNKPYSFAGMDFWALGCLIYQCLVGKPPFSASNEYLTFKKIESMEYELPDTLSGNATDIITKFLNADLENRLGMKGYDPIRNHEFFGSISWDWDEMIKQKVPLRPPTPDASPVKLDPNRHGRSSSAWNELENLKDVKVQNMQLDSDVTRETGASDGSINNLSAAGGGSGSSGMLSRMNTQKNNEQLYERWKKFLLKDETIEFGSAVSQSKMFGMSTDRSVMLLTNQNRILLVDGTEMKLKKDISTNTIKSIAVNDNSTITLRLAKKSMKLKITGQSAQRWKTAIESVMNSN